MDGDGTSRYVAVTRLAAAALADPEMVRVCQERMAEDARGWANRHGYDLVRVSWETVEEPDEPPWRMARLEMTATVRARWDGVWGDLRAALDEDGLLPPGDRRSRPEPPLRFPGAVIHTGGDPPIRPSPGDLWLDTTRGITCCYAWADGDWRPVTVAIDPARSTDIDIGGIEICSSYSVPRETVEVRDGTGAVIKSWEV